MFRRPHLSLNLTSEVSHSGLHSYGPVRLVSEQAAVLESDGIANNGLANKGLANNGLGNQDLSAELITARRFHIPSSPEHRLVAINDHLGVGAERLGKLASRLRRVQQRHGIRKLLVTSAIPGEGKTLICSNLAITLATHGQKTLIIDSDLRRPSVASLLGVGKQGGADWFDMRGPITQSLWRAEQLPLWVLPAEKPHDRALSLLQSDKFSEMLEHLSAMFDWVLIDSPPLTPFADAATLASLSDAVLFVTRQGVTPKNAMREAMSLIDPAKVVAIVLNEAIVVDHQYYKRYYATPPRPAALGADSTALPALAEKK